MALPVKDYKLHMTYIGVLTVLGQLARHAKGSEEREQIERVFADANKYFAERDVTMRFRRTADGGWGPFDQ